MKRYINNKFARIAIITAFGLAVIYLTAVLLLKVYTREIIQNTIEQQTEGKVSIDIGKVKVKLSPAKIELLNTRLLFHDEQGKEITYDIHFTYLGLQIHSLLDFLLHKKIVIDFLVAEDPKISVSPEFRKKKLNEGNHSVNFEIGNIYLAMNKIAKSMQIKRFGILNGHVTLRKLAPNNTTITIGGINITGKELAMINKDSLAAVEFMAGRIRVNTGKQDITFPEGDYRIQYSSLHLDTEEKIITLDGFQLHAKTKDTAYGSVDAGFSRLKIFNLDFWSLYEENLLKIDSVICLNPTLKIKLDVIPQENRKPLLAERHLKKKIAGMLGKMDIKYLGLIKSNMDFTSRKNGVEMSFVSKDDSFEAFDIKIDSTKEDPLQIGQLSFAIKNYKSPSKDGMYNFLFDSVVYRNRSLTLLNFRLEPSEINKAPDKKYFAIAEFELRELSIPELVSEKKLRAKELYLKNPITVNNYLSLKSKQKRTPKPMKLLLRELSDKIDLDHVVIENGFFVNQAADNKNQRIVVGGVRSSISVNEMFDASTYELMGYSIGRVAFDSAVISNGPNKTTLYKGEARGKEKKLTAASLHIKHAQNKTDILAKNIRIRNYHFDDEFRNIAVDSIMYESADITIDPAQAKPEKEDNQKLDKIAILLSYISAGKTNLTYLSGDSLKATVSLNDVEVIGANIDPGKKISVKKIKADGNAISFSSPSLSASTGTFMIRESAPSEINQIKVSYRKSRDTINGTVTQVRFVPEINKTLQLKYPVVSELTIQEPNIFASLEKRLKPTSSATEAKTQSLQIGSLAIIDGKINVKQRGAKSGLALKTTALSLRVDDIGKDIDGLAWAVGNTKLNLGSFDVSVNDSIRLKMDKGRFEFELERLVKGKDNERFEMHLGKILAKQLDISMLTKKGKRISFDRIDMGGEDLRIDSLDKNHILSRIKSNPSLFVSNINFSNVNEKSALYAYGIAYQNGGQIVTIDSFSFRPVMDRDSFQRMQVYQKDFMQVSTKKIMMRHVDLEKLGKDSSLQIDYVEVYEPYLDDYKDKRLPLDHNLIKPLPVDLLKKIKLNFSVDSVRLFNGRIRYEEFNDKTNMPASVHLSKLQARMRNVRNYNISPTDSLYLGATVSLLDTAFIRLRFTESYTDTLSAFLMQLKVGRFSLPLLNPVIGPMASAKVTSGYLDTLELIAIGREYIALGKMKMLYKDLNVQFLNKSDQEKKTIITKTISFLANLLVKRDNIKTTGTVFTERVREKGFVNYWIRIVLSGALTNAGIKSNSKQQKKYRKKIRKMQLPEIPDVQL